MQIDVIVLRRRTIQPVAVWLFATDENGTFSVLDEAGHYLPPKTAWRRLALKINLLACGDPDVTVDVFLFLRGQLLENLHNAGLMKEVVKAAREYTWGSNIYVAWDRTKETEFDSLYIPEWNRLVLKDWFSLLLEFGVTDLIEIPPQVRAKQPDLLKILHSAALESQERRRRLRKLVHPDGWRVVVRDSADFLEEFIRLLVTTERQLRKGNNRAVFYEGKPKRGWSQLLKQLPENFYGALFVAALPCSSAKDLKDLEGLWEQYSKGARLFYFNGIFEWLYAFIRLIQAAAAPDPEPPPEPHRDEIVYVQLAKRTLFAQAPADDDLSLLVTSAFHCSSEQAADSERAGDAAEAEEAEHCIAASREIGGIVSKLPFHVDVVVHHCIICERFPKCVTARAFTAWLHLSHGSKRGLYDEMIRQDASPQRWRDAFHTYKQSLQLVIFSACQSAEVARLFAEAGVRVAIGFEEDVSPVAAGELSVMVIPSALWAGERREFILHAFAEAVDLLRSFTHLDEDGEGEENYSSSKPKAFTAKKKKS